MNIDYQKASFKDFENIPGKNAWESARLFRQYVDNWESRGHWNYRQESLSGCMPRVELQLAGKARQSYIAMVFNDYLGFSQHPAVKAAAIAGIEEYGTGAAASPAIGGHISYHQQIEEQIARFFKRDNAILFTTGYTANTATMQALLKRKTWPYWIWASMPACTRGAS